MTVKSLPFPSHKAGSQGIADTVVQAGMGVLRGNLVRPWQITRVAMSVIFTKLTLPGQASINSFAVKPRDAAKREAPIISSCSTNNVWCVECQREIEGETQQEHADFHIAKRAS